MKVSVVIPTYSMERYADFYECVESVFSQTYQDIESVIIVDGNENVYERAKKDFEGRDDVVIYCSEEFRGPISRANMGVIQASGDLVVLTDDDAVADSDWIQQLVETYERHDTLAVGGKIVPEWVAGKAHYIPEEFYFLIGATHRGFPDEVKEVRNTFGANLGFDRDVFLKLGGIKQGGIDLSQIQGRESEFCARIRRVYGCGVMYNPDAVVRHKIYGYRTEPKWLVKRAFWQGYSKRAMQTIVPDSSDEETDQLRRLLLEFIPGRIARLFRHPNRIEAMQLFTLITLLVVVGIGYLYGILWWRQIG